jgi:hypothetical protein
MWTGARRDDARRAARVALGATCLIALALGLRAEASTGAAINDAPREKDVRRAEKVLAMLESLDEAAARPDGGLAFRSLTARFYPDLFVKVSEMREGDLKTDLGTAAFLYEEASRVWLTTGAAAADCRQQRPDIYSPLCANLQEPTTRRLLISRARLHASWAGAVVKTYRGTSDAETPRALSAMKAARKNDLLIAGRILDALKTLDALAKTSAEPMRRAAATSGPARSEEEFGAALREAGMLLAWLPRGPVFYHLSNAQRSYRDGLFWKRKAGDARRLTVSAYSFDRNPLEDLRLDAQQVGRTVEANWKTATKYILLAERTLADGGRRF